ncbi:MAG: O-antigen ligase family protein [Candidatus Omnitrophica bacterium]|nr:O-antigen ligase family protein [Candidatus Omnitrophota bacterium]
MIELLLNSILIFAPIARGAVRIWAYASVYIIILAAFLIYIFKQLTYGEIRIKRTPLDAPILLFFILSLIAVFRSDYIYGSVMEIARFIILGLVFYLVVNCITIEKQIKRILNLILVTGTGIAMFGILQYLGVLDKSWWDKPLFLSATYVNHNHFAGLTGLVIPLSIGMALSEKDMGKKSLYIYCFLVLCIAFLLSMSRGGWISLAAAMGFMTVMIFKKNRNRSILFMFVLLAVIFGVFVLNTTYLESLLRRLSSYGELDFEGRLEIWKGTLGVIKNNWLLGTGPGTFIYNFPRYRPAGFNVFANYAHNDYLQIASEMGIFALCLMLFIISVIVKKALTTHRIARSSFKSWISLSLAAGILSMSIHGLGDFNFYIPANVIIFVVFSGLVFNISSKKEKDLPQLVLRIDPPVRRFFKPLAAVVIITSIVFISAALAAEICSTASDRAIIRNDLAEAERLSIAATRLCRFNHSYPYRLANIYTKKAQTMADGREYINKSVEGYKKSLDLNPVDAWSWIELADSYYQLSRSSLTNVKFLKLADSAYKEAIELDPSNWYYLKRHAGFLLNTGNARLSSEVYKRVSAAMSESEGRLSIAETFMDEGSYEDMADLAFAARDINKAMAYYEMAEAIREDNENAKLGQVRCYLKRFLIKDALLKYRKLRFSARRKSLLFTSLGEYYLNKGYVGTAERFLEKSRVVDPRNPEVYQLAYKISKKIVRAHDHDSEIYRILDFNRIPVTSDLKTGGFELRFDIKKDMCEKGEFGIDMFLPAGMYEFKVKARGEDSSDTWPHMIVKFNNKDAMDIYVSDDWKEYSGIIIVDSSSNRFGIVFDNDYYDEGSMKDRNLYIDGISLRAL